MRDQVKQTGVEPGIARQFLSIDPVTLATTAANGWQLAGMSDQDFMTVLAQALTHPERVRSGFESNASRVKVSKLFM